MSSFSTLFHLCLLYCLFVLGTSAEDSSTTTADGDNGHGKSFRARNDFETYAYKVLSQLEDYTGDSVSSADLKAATDAVQSAITWIGTNLHLPLTEYVTRRRQLEETIGPVLSVLEEVIDFDKDEL
ncbi:Endoplasmic reticulum chaperone BiP [Tyrophagus putrescentiae]|nr:Endoplasmic reticulum chaperone BiP [Tyrophagus putrescentiae]